MFMLLSIMIVHMDSASPTVEGIAGNKSDVSGGSKTLFGAFTPTLAEEFTGSGDGAHPDRRSHYHHPSGYGYHQ